MIGIEPQSTCPRCGYLQITRTGSVTCSECGLPNIDIPESGLLRWADSAWTTRLVAGCRVIRIGGLCMLSAWLSALAIAMLRAPLRSWLGAEWSGTILDATAWLCAAAACVALLLLPAGLILLFAHEPYKHAEIGMTLRRLLTYCIAPVMALWILNALGLLGDRHVRLWINACGFALLLAHTLSLLRLTDGLRMRCVLQQSLAERSHIPPYAACSMFGVPLIFALLEPDSDWLRMSWLLWFGAVSHARWSLEPALHTELAYRPAASPTQPKS